MLIIIGAFITLIGLQFVIDKEPVSPYIKLIVILIGITLLLLGCFT
jgi:hypothetical protein